MIVERLLSINYALYCTIIMFTIHVHVLPLTAVLFVMKYTVLQLHYTVLHLSTMVSHTIIKGIHTSIIPHVHA